jgi:uncharacterized protein
VTESPEPVIILFSQARGMPEQDCACAVESAPPLALWAPPEEAGGDDCACSEPLTALYSSSDALDALWQLPGDLYRVGLTHEYELFFNPGAPLNVVVLNTTARDVLESFCRPRPLTSEADRKLAMLGLLTSSSVPDTRKVRTQNYVLTVWLHLTEVCNLRCSYCYVRPGRRTMDVQTGYAALESVFRSALANGFHTVKLKYAGGEPTLCWPLVHLLHEKAGELARQHAVGLQEVLLSNGTLLDKGMIEWLRRERVNLMLSLDGLGPAHDAHRHYADGSGSFTQVVSSIELALEHGLTPFLSITVTPGSVHELPGVIAFALERDLPFNLNFVRSRAIPVSQAARESFIAGLRAGLRVIEAALPRRRLVDGLLDRSNFSAPHAYACSAGRSYLVIDTDGNVFRCQMAMDQPVTDIRAADPLRLVREWRGGFQSISVEEKEDCRHCPWRYWCAGGCPLLTYQTSGRSDAPSPYCTVYRAIYPDVVRLEGLRLLKWSPVVA